MTDEERQKLCSLLRDPGDYPFTFQVEMFMKQAANEIERLAKQVQQANYRIGALEQVRDEWQKENEAASEIERLAAELAKAQRLCGQMLQKQHALERDAELWRRRND